MHSRILHYAIHSTTRIALLYHPESNPFRLAPLTFPSLSKGILSDYLKLQDNRSTILIYVSLFYSILFYSIQSTSLLPALPTHSNSFDSFKSIALDQRFCFGQLNTSLIITPNKKKRKSIFNKYSFSEDHYTISMAALYASQPLLFKNQTDIV